MKPQNLIEKKGKICHMASVHTRGDARVFYKQCVSLSNAGYDVFLLVADGGIDEIKDNVKIVSVEYTNERWKRVLFKNNALYKKALSLNCDIYQIHDPELLPYALKLKRKGKKVIYDSHEDLFSYIQSNVEIGRFHMPYVVGKVATYFLNTYFKYVYKRMDVLITVNPIIVEKLKKVNPKTYMLTNYPLKNSFEYKEIDRKKHFVFAGMISEEWGQRKIINNLPDNIDWRYTLCGTINKDYKKEIESFPNWTRVDYLGRLPFLEVANHLLEASVGVAILNYSANTGNKIGTIGNQKIFEYMSAALPFICTDFDTWKEIIDKYNCAICVNPYDEKAIREAMMFFVNNPDKAREMGRNGRKAFEQEYNWECQEKTLLNIYTTL